MMLLTSEDEAGDPFFPLQGMKLWEHIHGADMSTGGFGVER